MSTWTDFDFVPPQPLASPEQTPVSNPIKEEGPTSGCYRNCYLCGIETARLHKDSIVSYLYTKERTKDEISNYITPAKYVITYCSDCYGLIYPNK